MAVFCAILVAVICLLASCSEGVEVPPPKVTRTNGARRCIPPPSSNEEDRENVTARCTASMGSVVWLMGDYAMVDRDQFRGDTFGVLIEDSESNNSSLTLFPNGADFLLERFNQQTFTISCQTVVNEVNTRRADSSPLTLYGAFSDIEPPEVKVMHCNAEGSYTISITYEKSNDTCVEEMDIKFSVSLSDETSNCRNDKDDLTWSCDVKNTANLTVTLTASVGAYSRDFTSYLTNITCNKATWKLCTNGDETSIMVSPNFVEETNGWDWDFTNGGDGSLHVVDILPGGGQGGQSFPAINNTNLKCSSDDDPDGGFEFSTAAIGGISVGGAVVVVIAIVIVIFIIYCCVRHCCKEEKSQSGPNTVPNAAYNQLSIPEDKGVEAPRYEEHHPETANDEEKLGSQC